MSFGKQLGAAAAAVTLVVWGLWALGQSQEDSSETVTAVGTSAEEGVPEDVPAPGAERKGPGSAAVPLNHPTRALVPPQAWAVVDFQGDLAGSQPFADSEGFCAEVPPPARVGLAVLPPATPGSDSPEILLVAPRVDDPFWGCVRDRIVTAGGTALAQNEQFEVLESPSGVVAHGPQQALAFLSGEGHLERALAVLSQLSPGASEQGPHLELFRRLHPQATEPPKTLLDFTLALPKDWLASVGEEARASPLRYLSAAYLTVAPDGSAIGGVICQDDGCQQVLSFLQRAQDDLLQRLEPATASAIRAGLKLRYLEGAGRISISWTPSDVGIASLLERLLADAPFGLRAPGTQ